jgi:hypothetical protein
MKSFDQMRHTFPDFYAQVREVHQNSSGKHRGHGLDHDVTVATLAVRISPDEKIADAAWIASMLHSIDHLFPNMNYVDSKLGELMNRLPRGYFTHIELKTIMAAVLRHAEMNRDDQSLVQQVLMDADRLANLQLAVIIRAGQYRPTIPALEFDHLDASHSQEYRKPANILDNIRVSMRDYLPQLRITKAKIIAVGYVKQLEEFLKNLELQYEEIGLRGAVL